MKKVLHIITSLNGGGAEKILFDFIAVTHEKGIHHTVVSLSGHGFYSEKLSALGVKIFAIKINTLKGIFKLIKLLYLSYRSKPDIIHTWLYHSNFISILFYIIGFRNIVWSIHSTQVYGEGISAFTSIINKLCAWFSFVPQYILYCASSSKIEHEKFGYNKSRSMVIYNGYNTALFKSDYGLKTALRNNLAITSHNIVIGHVARFHPVKDHYTFIKSLSLLDELLRARLTIVMIGDSVDVNNKSLKSWLSEAQILDQTILLGMQENISQFYTMMDLLVLSSISEAFPNVVAEAMASEVSCVVTDVGDAKLIVGDYGYVVPIGDANALANAITKVINLSSNERLLLGREARSHIEQNFALERMVNSYLDTYESVTTNYKCLGGTV
ncbi:MAG: glycosyltransferase [Burkholderiales bacterium]|nr:glycosyltransferase [Burkholderiales bacterium]